MPTVTIMRGLPGSGKSTIAQNILDKKPNTVRVNRDSLRAMLHGGQNWTTNRERATVEAETALIKTLLRFDKDLIIDDTNLDQKTLDMWIDLCNGLANEDLHIHVNVMDLTRRVPIEECIRRDRQRTGTARVGRGVIERMALENGLIDLSGYDNVAIVDVDGTLANLTHRLYCLETEPKNYDVFFKTVVADSVYATVWDAVIKMQEAGFTIIVLSGRPTSTGHDTNEWLAGKECMTEGRKPIKPKHLFMRKSGDHRPDDQVKRQLMMKMFDAGLRKDAIKVVLDDRESVCEVWRELQLPLIKVSEGTIVEIVPAPGMDFQHVHNLGIPINYERDVYVK